ncbi:hypothetical protein ACTL6P_16750 [Endozoicomonas acroporae]|uniref:hypothetical protein n=1 Tax=Endozoicomonas acroporae TaxID=1701104 RepID=UPI0011AFA24B|nr:hypothetical protein [Endozoicomonas acroporae]
MNMPSISAKSTAVFQPQCHGDQKGESASAAPVKFDRWMISLSEIDSFLRGKDHEAVESIAERMCTRSKYQQGTKSFGLSNLEKDSGACALPVDDSQGCSQEQKVKNVTGLILRLQSGVHQLLDEVNGHFAEEPFTGTKEASQAGDGNNIVPEDDSWPGFSGLPVGQPDSAYQFATSERLENEEQKREFIQKKVKQLFIKARIAMDLFPARPSEEELRDVEALFEQARLELKEMEARFEQEKSELAELHSQSNKELYFQFNKLKEKLQPYKDNISDSQQTAASTRWRAGNFSCYTGWRAGNFSCYTGLYETKRFLKGKPYLMRTVQHLPPPGTKISRQEPHRDADMTFM